MRFEQHATTLITAPVEAVEEKLRDVRSWSAFLFDVHEIVPSGPDRYLFQIRSGPRTRSVVVAVHAQPRQHQYRWNTVQGPMYAGCLSLQPRGAWTTASLAMTTRADGFLANLVDMVTPRIQARRNLRLLQHNLMAGAAHKV